MSATTEGGMFVRSVLAEVHAERARQDTKWGEQNHPDGTGDDVRLLGDIDLPTYGTLAYRAKALVDSLAAKGRSQYAPILLEEVFEALSALNEDELRTELIQVAAVCVQWVQAIDRRAQLSAPVAPWTTDDPNPTGEAWRRLGDDAACCEAKGPIGFWCTWPVIDHPAWHVAGAGHRTAEVWPVEPQSGDRP